MDAVVSGRAGKALLLDNNSLRSFDVDDPGTLLSLQQPNIRILFGDAPDLEILEDTDADSVAGILDHEYNCACALDLTLITFDPELSEEVRVEAVEALEELLVEERVVERLENILYGRPLPRTADIDGALSYSETTQTLTVRDLLHRLHESQQAVREVYLAWNAISASAFGSNEQQTEFQRIVVREGLFRALVMAHGNQHKVNGVRLTFMLNPSIRAMPNHREILQQWVAPFLQPATLQSLTLEVEDEDRPEPQPERVRRRGHQSFDRKAVLDKVKSQKETIIKAMQQHDLARIRNIVDELIAYQMTYGGAEFLVKSLCDLAIEAKALGNHSLQLELTQRCIDLKPDDEWSWAQHGDALLNMNRPAEALIAYEQADAFGAGVIAKKGRAEVLKALGRLNDALDAFDTVITEHPEDVVAKTGRAEVLKSMGRLNDALVAYDAAIAEHPESAVAKRGRAEVLKSMGRLNGALVAYDAVIAENPEDVVAKTGRAEVLKSMGRLNDALAAYDALIAKNPQDDIARSGRSCVLVALHRYDEALKSLPNENLVTQADWIGYHIRGMVLLRKGNIDEAVQVFERGVESNPWIPDRAYFRTALAIACLKRRDFIQASQVLDEVTEPLLQPPANVLRLHSFGELGEREPAITAYDKLSDRPQFIRDDLVDELHRRYILKEEPRHDDDWVNEQEVDLMLLVANQYAIASQSYLYQPLLMEIRAKSR